MAKVQAMIGIHKEAPLVIGFVGEMPTLYIVDVNLGNVPDFPMVHDDVLRGAGLAQPIQFYWKE